MRQDWNENYCRLAKNEPLELSDVNQGKKQCRERNAENQQICVEQVNYVKQVMCQ